MKNWILGIIRNFLCRRGIHYWNHVFGPRHWHVECQWCGHREIWKDHDTSSGYHPISHQWTNEKVKL